MQGNGSDNSGNVKSQGMCACCGLPLSGHVGAWGGLFADEGNSCDWTMGEFCGWGLSCQDNVCVAPGRTASSYDIQPYTQQECENMGGTYDEETGCSIPGQRGKISAGGTNRAAVTSPNWAVILGSLAIAAGVGVGLYYVMSDGKAD